MRNLPGGFHAFALWATVAVAAAAAGSCSSPSSEPEGGQATCEVKPSQTFHDRIEPLLADGQVSTCNQCHLSGVNLSAFARETPCKTMACLVEQGLVDLDAPSESLVLSWIKRASPDSSLITEEVIDAEYEAFSEWIAATASCPEACRGVTCGSPQDGPTCSSGTADEVPELPPEQTAGCSDGELEQAFFERVYAWRGRCFPCHFDTELNADPEAPRWLSAIGNCETGSVATFRSVVGSGLIDTASPADSLLLRKPLADAAGGVEHGGGSKFSGTLDPAYASFLRFVEHYSACVAK